MLGIDTNVIVRYIVADDKAQAQAAKRILTEKCSPESPGYLTVIAMVELFWTLRRTYKFSHADITIALQGLLRAKELRFERPDQVRYAFKQYAVHHRDFADALLGAVAASEGCEHTVTFDKGAAKLEEFILLKY